MQTPHTNPWRCLISCLAVWFAGAAILPAGERPDARAVAREVDETLAGSPEKARAAPAALDAEFLRRVSLDLTGKLPTPDEVTLFALDPDPEKRSRLVEEKLASAEFGQHWARYWRDAIFYRSQDARARLAAPALERWLDAGFAADRGWDETAAAFVTATGSVTENGATALILAQMAQAEDLAAETSRLFLGIQIQCAQCHDHPHDSWKREDFHRLAAFYPRVRVRRSGAGNPPAFEIASAGGAAPRERPAGAQEGFLRRLDRDGDGKVARGEVPENFRERFERLLKRADGDGDGVLTLAEAEKAMPPGDRRGDGEHHLPDLEHPEKRGPLIHPVFPFTGASPGERLPDLERRQALARYLTAPENPWFARAFVNRVWAELFGQGFVEPVDDMGPGRKPLLPEALDLLADGFRRNGHSLKWLLRAVTATRAYGAAAAPGAAGAGARSPAAVCPSRLSADQLFDALAAGLGLDALAPSPGGERGAGRRSPGGARAQFAQLFGYDPSTPQEDLAGTVPQALFLMNSGALEAALRATGDRPLARLLRAAADDRTALTELYLRALARRPSEKELATCLEYIRDVGRREEAFEDIFWSLINSTEFLLSR